MKTAGTNRIYFQLHFGMELDDIVYPQASTETGVLYLGTNKMLSFLERHTGTSGHQEGIDFLRMEQYRQVLVTYLKIEGDAFFAESFNADELGTAAALLGWRDELLMNGWDFAVSDGMPSRLRVLSNIEQIKQDNLNLPLSDGYADRFAAMLKLLPFVDLPVEGIILNEPLELLPPHWRRLFAVLSEKGIRLTAKAFTLGKTGTDLGRLQYQIQHKNEGAISTTATRDGSLVILKSPRETDAATFLAKIFQQNRHYQPLLLIPEKNRALDNALVQEGLSSLGILSASLARPTLQILKLVTSFLWKPIDPVKILEFITLPIKPLREDLAIKLAQELAQTPGLNGERWFAIVSSYFEELSGKSSDPNVVIEARKQYDFWFNRPRQDTAKKVSRQDVREIFDYVVRWAFKQFEENGNRQTSLLVLGEQARRIVELLDAFPDTEHQLSFLQLERIVRTIYSPSPVQFEATQAGFLPYIYNESAVLSDVPQVLWWNFCSRQNDHFFSQWYAEEVAYLQTKKVLLTTPQARSELKIWQRLVPLLRCRERLVLVIPTYVDGQEVLEHPLLGDIKAIFSNYKELIVDTENAAELGWLGFWKLPTFEPLVSRELSKPSPYIQIEKSLLPDEEKGLYYSDLQNIFYYPYQWVFKKQLQLRKSSILSVVKDPTLMGNLAHRVIQLLLEDNKENKWSKEEVYGWIDRRITDLLQKEGAPLLMYGREPERSGFIEQLKNAAWTLLSAIRANGWKIVGKETEGDCIFCGIKVSGRADLVLRNDKKEMCVIDLKWSGSGYEEIIRNGQDLQLVLYSKIFGWEYPWAHTAYYVMDRAKFIARNDFAFKNAVKPTVQDADQWDAYKKIWKQMEATFRWRCEQLREGKIEIRTEDTTSELEEMNAEYLMHTLEMKDKDTPYNDFITLIKKY